MKKLIALTILASALVQLGGCATIHKLTGLGAEPAPEVPEDPVEAAALAFRAPASLADAPAPYLADPVETQASPDQIRVGMAKSDVVSAWGRPSEVETAGDPHLGHERWVYFRGLASRWGLSSRDSQRVVYFEGGRVAGWENAR